MPIPVVCSGCGKNLKAPDTAAGKRTKCPACQTPIEIPAAGSSPGAKASDSWEIKTGTGDTYGPVSKAELDQWVKEGRLDDQCQVLQKGAPQWQWASQLYPELAEAADSFGQAASPQAQPTFGQPTPVATFQSPTPTFQTSGAVANPFSQDPRGANPYASSSSVASSRTRPASDGGIITVAILNFVLSGLCILCGLLTALAAVGMATVFSGVSRRVNAPGEIRALGGAIMAVIIVVGILYLIYGVMLIAAGIGLLKREQWGRILTFVCAGFAGLIAMFQVLGLIGGSWQAAVGLLIFGGYCVAAFVLLLLPGTNLAFQKRRR